MKGLYELYVNRNRLCLVLVFLFFIVLLFRLQEIQIKLLPELTPLRYFIVTDFPNHSAIDVDQTVSLPLSNRISSLKSVKRIRTSSVYGESSVQIDLQFGSSVSEFKDGLYQLLYEIKEYLPFGVRTPKLLARSEYENPFVEIVIPKPENRSLLEFDYQLQRIMEQLERISGVISVICFGDEKSNVLISLDQNHSKFFPIKLRDLEFQIQSGLQSGSLGKYYGTKEATEIKFQSEISDSFILKQFPIHLGNGEFFPLERISRITKVPSRRNFMTRWNGEESIYIRVAADPNHNPLQIAKQIDVVLSNNNGLPGIKIVSNSVSELRAQLFQFFIFFLISFGFALLFSYLLYQNLHGVIILSLSVCFTLVLFLHLLVLFSISINLLSLSGISVGIGMLFDANNLTYYSIDTEWKKSEECPHFIKMEKGVRSIWTSLVSSSFTTIIVFLPLLLYVHEWREFFFGIGLCIVLLLFSSLCSSIIFVPLFYVSLEKLIPKSHLPPNAFAFLERLRKKISSCVSDTFIRRSGFLFGLPILMIVFLYFPKFLIFPEPHPVGKTIQLFPKQNISDQELGGILLQMSHVCKINEPNMNLLVIPIGGKKFQTLTETAVPFQIKILGEGNHFECMTKLTQLFPESKWTIKVQDIPSEITKSLPFQSKDHLTILNANWDLLVQFYEMVKNTNHSLDGKFSYEPKPVAMEFWSPKKIPMGMEGADPDEFRRQILYANHAKYLGTIGPGEKEELFLSTNWKENSVLGEENWNENHSKETMAIQKSIPIEGFYDKKMETVYEDYKRESGLYYLEWFGGNRLMQDSLLDKTNGFQFFLHSERDEIVNFFIILSSLLLLSFCFVYLLLVAIYESFLKPFLHLFVCLVVFVTAMITLFLLVSEIHFGHYIGIVILLGVSVDNISIYDEKWREFSYIQGTEIRNAKVLHWIEKPVLLNSGTTVFGLLPIIVLNLTGMEFVRSIAISMLIGILVSLFFFYFLYPKLFGKNWV
ncbi:efflux RND transporter permease subunit [Leptospira jelokensis]|uniref:Efflux RND transporter permease subunit n=1 Tax=Leptospira jelokensis TaxID=2484931 RepID=A0A4Z0ZV32_9LEPT|nr:efflux RND transporter permease subunit [Leptospira jelokensis]TGL69846.1 efflux RND transporter permease subunit [Leptospira jelokensis]